MDQSTNVAMDDEHVKSIMQEVASKLATLILFFNLESEEMFVEE